MRPDTELQFRAEPNSDPVVSPWMAAHDVVPPDASGIIAYRKTHPDKTYGGVGSSEEDAIPLLDDDPDAGPDEEPKAGPDEEPDAGPGPGPKAGEGPGEGSDASEGPKAGDDIWPKAGEGPEQPTLEQPTLEQGPRATIIKSTEISESDKERMNQIFGSAFPNAGTDYVQGHISEDLSACLLRVGTQIEGVAFAAKKTMDADPTLVSPTYYLIHSVAISPEKQGQGYCKDIMGALVKEFGNLPMYLNVRTTKGNPNTAGIRCYERHGFHLIECIAEIKDDGPNSVMIRDPNNQRKKSKRKSKKELGRRSRKRRKRTTDRRAKSRSRSRRSRSRRRSRRSRRARRS